MVSPVRRSYEIMPSTKWTARLGDGRPWRYDGRGAMPTFLARAHQEERVRRALAEFGYRRVLAAYVWQRRNQIGNGTFYGLTREGLSPSLDFVGAWLKDEKKRIRTQVRSTFLATMGVTVATGLIFGLSQILIR
jgi:hypothetical protein